MDSFLRKRVIEGAVRRYGQKNNRDLLERAKKQVEHELVLIARLGFIGYFLIVWDVVQYCMRCIFTPHRKLTMRKGRSKGLIPAVSNTIAHPHEPDQFATRRAWMKASGTNSFRSKAFLDLEEPQLTLHHSYTRTRSDSCAIDRSDEQSCLSC